MKMLKPVTLQARNRAPSVSGLHTVHEQFARAREINNFRFGIIDENSETTIVELYETIGEGLGGISPAVFSHVLRKVKTPKMELRLHSPGGSVTDGVAMYNELRLHKSDVTVRVMGAALSIAAVLAMGGDRVEIAKGGYLMIHNAWSLALGDAKSLREAAEVLEKMDGSISQTFAGRTGIDAEKIREMMAAETWLTGDEAVSMNFADALLEDDSAEKEAAALNAGFNFSCFRNVPREFADIKPDNSKPVNSGDDLAETTAALQRLLASLQ